MTHIKGNINLDCLKTDSPTHHIGEKLVLAQNTRGWKIEWMTPEKISTLKKSGSKLIESLDTISRSIKDLEPLFLTDDEVKSINENACWIQSKNEKHNKKIEFSTFLNLIDKIVRLFTFGKHTLKYDSLEPLVTNLTQESSWRVSRKQFRAPKSILSQQAQPQPPKIIHKSSEELLMLSDAELLNYFKGVSFPTKFSITDFTKMSDSQKELYFKLLKLKHKETVKHLIESPEFSKALCDEASKNPVIKNEPAFAAWFNTYEKMINVKFIPQKLKYDLFRTALFIEENRSLISAGTIGSQSQTKPEILKIKISPKNGGFRIP